MKIKSITSLRNLAGKRVLVRVDYNVPIENGKIKENFKIEESLPTIEFLRKKGAKIILVSHLGRPKKRNLKFSLKPIAKNLEKIINSKVLLLDINDKTFNEDNEFEKLDKKIEKMSNGRVVCLENIRFLSGEQLNDQHLAKALASLADIFVLDGFAVAHRDTASVSGIPKYIPSYAGILLEKELKGLSKILKKPKKPFVVVLGGIKIHTKIPIIKKLLPKATHILIGGGIANTYLWAKGCKVGGSVIDKDKKKIILSYFKNKKIIMPVDVIIGTKNGKKVEAIDIDDKFKITDPKKSIYDIGPKTISLYTKYIKSANTIVWNGALGMFEQAPYNWGGDSLARLMASRSKGRAFGVTGGGETVEIVRGLNLTDDIDLVSTGGGAMLEFLSGKKLPGIKALEK